MSTVFIIFVRAFAFVLFRVKASLTLSFCSFCHVNVKKADLTDQMNAKSEELDEKEMRWMELAEAIEEAEAEN